MAVDITYFIKKEIMKNKYILSPSILSADFTNLKSDINKIEAEGADWIHVDAMDGHYVPNLTMGPFIIENLRKITNKPIDVHLMIENPDQYIPQFADAGANLLTVHVEASVHLHRTISLIKSHGCKAGVALNPSTSVLDLEEILPFVDLVLVMSINPGFSGQKFIPEMLRKMNKVRMMLDAIDSSAYLQVDGGINNSTIEAVLDAGADNIVASSAIFKHPKGIAEGMNIFKQAFAKRYKN